MSIIIIVTLILQYYLNVFFQPNFFFHLWALLPVFCIQARGSYLGKLSKSHQVNSACV